MAVLLVTYDLKQPGRDYAPVYAYLKRYTHCKGLESVYLLDTTADTSKIRDDLMAIVDANDKVFVSRLAQDWGSFNYTCAEWLKAPGRGW